MNDSKIASETQGIHYVQAAQRLGISVQRLMDLERSGAIEPPASLDSGRGRHYTQAELDAIAERLSMNVSSGGAGSGRLWWLAATAAALALVFIGLDRDPAPPQGSGSERKPAAVRPIHEPQPRAEEPEAEEESDHDDSGPEPSFAGADYPRPLRASSSGQEGLTGEQLKKHVEELHERGIFY